jgi:hypothetical protein
LPTLAIRRLPALVWALPTTCVGLLLMGVALATRGRVRRVAGVLEVHGGLIGRALARIPLESGVAAITLGHVVLGTDAAALAATREHERVHVSQCERWGPFFLPAYLGSSLWALVRGAHPYRDNWFERRAYAGAGDGVAPTKTDQGQPT